MNDLTFSVTEFLSVINQTLEFAFPIVTIEGELSELRISKGKWLYFKLKDDTASVNCFGTVYMLPGPLEDGMKVKVTGAPRHHLQYGFSFNAQNIAVSGEGSLKRAQDLLQQKLTKEGLFDDARKRVLPSVPERIGLITSRGSAAEADFIKILAERWAGVEILLRDSLVQGIEAPNQLVQAITEFNQLEHPPEVLVIIRGGGSQDDLAAFSDERVVRAVSASRVPTLIAIGHEVDLSLAEMTADKRASTPSNAAQLLVPDKHYVVGAARGELKTLGDIVEVRILEQIKHIHRDVGSASKIVDDLATRLRSLIENNKVLLNSYDPRAILQRGYAIISRSNQSIHSVKQLSVGESVSVRLHDGRLSAEITSLD